MPHLLCNARLIPLVKVLQIKVKGKEYLLYENILHEDLGKNQSPFHKIMLYIIKIRFLKTPNIMTVQEHNIYDSSFIFYDATSSSLTPFEKAIHFPLII